MLQRRLVERLVEVLQHSDALHSKHLDALKGRVSRVDAALGRVDAVKDQDFFIEHNIRPFTAPTDWVFEPCTFHYDTVSYFRTRRLYLMRKPQSDLNTEPTPKIFLQNKLTQCRSKLQELVPLIAAKRKSSSAVQALKQLNKSQAKS